MNGLYAGLAEMPRRNVPPRVEAQRAGGSVLVSLGDWSAVEVQESKFAYLAAHLVILHHLSLSIQLRARSILGTYSGVGCCRIGRFGFFDVDFVIELSIFFCNPSI